MPTGFAARPAISGRYSTVLTILLALSWPMSASAVRSITNSTTLNESFTGFTGTATPTDWFVQGTGPRGTTWNGTNQAAGTNAGWYGNSNMSFLGKTTNPSATNGNGTWQLRNLTGGTITDFTITYTGRLWNTGTVASNVSASWQASTSASNPAQGALTNNLASLAFTNTTAGISSGVSFNQPVTGVSIPTGQYIYVRLIHNTPNTGTAANMGWDDVTFTPIITTSAPLLTNLDTDQLNYTEGQSASSIDQAPAASAFDSDGWLGSDLTVSYLSGSAGAEDQLSVRVVGTITLTGNNVFSSGVQIATIDSTLNGVNGAALKIVFNVSATNSSLSEVIRNIGYSNSSQNPSALARSVQFVLTDGAGAGSASAVTTVTVAPINNAPTVSGGGAVSFTEDGPAVAVHFAALVADPDSPALAGGTVTISNLLDGAAELLAADVTGTAILANYSGGVLTLTGVDSLANYQQVLRTITYSNSLQNPNTTARTVSFVLNDGALSGTAANRTVNVVAVNDNPVLDTNAGLSLSQGGNSVIGSSALSTSDVDNTTAQITYTITAAPSSGSVRKSGVVVTSFTQADVNAGIISYQANPVVATSDSFSFSVADSAGGPGGTGVFSITLVPNVYTWQVNGSGSYTAAASWLNQLSATRATLLVTDQLVVDGSLTPNVTITNVPTQTIGRLALINNANALLTAVEAVALTLGPGGTNVLRVDAGSSLWLSGGSGNEIVISIGSVASPGTSTIDGDIVFNATGSNTPHRIIAHDTDTLNFAAGSSAAMAPSGGSAKGGFGDGVGLTSVNFGVRFLAGSTYYQGGLKDGTRSGKSGKNPFGKTAPASVCSFDPGSYYIVWNAEQGQAIEMDERIYGYFIWRASTSTPVIGALINARIYNDLTIEPSGTATNAPLLFGLTGGTGNLIQVDGDFIVQVGSGGFVDNGLPSGPDSIVNVAGNVDIQDPALFTPNPSPNRVYQLNGVTQTANFGGVMLGNFKVAAGSTAQLTGDLNTRISAVVDGDLAVNTTAALTFSTGTATVAGSLTVNGTLNTSETIVEGAGSMLVNTGGTVEMKNAGGIDAQIAVTGTETFLADSNYIYDGSTAQAAGSSLPAQVGILTVNNGGLSLANDMTISGALNMTSGTIEAAGNLVELGTGPGVVGTLTVTRDQSTTPGINGRFKRWVNGVGDWLFPICGGPTPHDAVVTFTTPPVPGTLTAECIMGNPGTNGLPVTDGTHTCVVAAPDAYWSIEPGDGLVPGIYDLSLDATGFGNPGNDLTIRILKRNSGGGNPWGFAGSAGANSFPIIRATNIVGFSEFAFGGAEGQLPVNISAFSID